LNCSRNQPTILANASLRHRLVACSTGREILIFLCFKVRLAFLTNDAHHRLVQWLKIRGQSIGPLFVSATKAGTLGTEPLRGQSIRFILQSRATEAGVKPFSPHSMRRTMATHLLDRGVDLAIVQKMLDHRHLNTTALYDRRGEAAKCKASTVLQL
jgi:site-specific recombinase XerD